MIYRNKFISAGRFLCRKRKMIPLVFSVLLLCYVFFASPYILSKANIFDWGFAGVFISLGFVVRWLAEDRPSNHLESIMSAGGIYSVIRFPFYLSDFLLMLGVVVAVGSLFLTIIFILVSVLVSERMIIFEESISYNRRGDEYAKWYRSTNAIIPVIWNWEKSTFKRSVFEKVPLIVGPLLYILFLLNCVYILAAYRITFRFSVNYLFLIPLLFVIACAILYVRLKIPVNKSKNIK